MNGTKDPTNDEMLAEIDVSDGLSASGNLVSQRVETAINSEDINVRYGDNHALTDITMDIPGNSVIAMIGPFSCGKSMFLRCINHMNDLIDVARAEGRLTLRGRNVYDDDVDLVVLHRRISIVFQKPNSFPKSIYENIVYGLKIQGTNADYDAVVEESLKRAAPWDEVKDHLHESGLDFSSGQQQRLCTVCAITTDPEVLPMDGPASMLDPMAISQIEDLVEEFAENCTAVIVTYDMQWMARTSDKTAVFLTGGELVEFDDTQKIFENPGSQRVEDYITGKSG